MGGPQGAAKGSWLARMLAEKPRLVVAIGLGDAQQGRRLSRISAGARLIAGQNRER
jgi:hypothetical protein